MGNNVPSGYKMRSFGYDIFLFKFWGESHMEITFLFYILK